MTQTLSLLTPLTQLFLQNEHTQLFEDSNGGVSVAEIRGHVNKKYAFLKQQKSKNCLIYRADTSDFLSDMLACIYAGVDITLPPNFQKITIDRVKKITDVSLDDLVDNKIHKCIKKKDCDITQKKYQAHNINVNLFTSGTTGQAKSITRPLSYLLEEAQTLENLWGNKIKDAVVLTTVSHQHIYGLLFKVLWPLCYGHSVWKKKIPFEENLYFLIQKFNKTILVSSPAFLTRLNSHSLHTKELHCTFSSGGKLSEESAQQVESFLNTKCIRVFGSTETGGIAYQTSNTELWTAFPKVKVRQNGEIMEVSSPYCYQQPWFSTADRVRLTSGNSKKQQFILLGRADDIVKIEEKRISITEVENALCQHKLIKKAKVIELPLKRRCLGAVLILHNDSRKPQKAHFFQKEVRNFLSDYFETVTIPKYFRYVSEFPENEQGKIDYNDILKLFNSSDTPDSTN